MTAGIKASSDGLYGTLQVNSADIVTFNSSGNVGVGTLTPTNLLQIRKDQSAAETYGIVQNDGAASSTTYAGWMIQDGAVVRSGIRRQRDGAASATQVGTFSGTSPLALWAGDAERVRIDTSGNLGIGTTSPTSRLTIGSGSYSAPSAGTSGLYTDASLGLVMLANKFYFGRTDGNVSATIDSSGNLLVGTTSAVANQGVIQAKSAVTGGPAQYSATNTVYNSGSNNWSFGMNSGGAFVIYINPAVGGNLGVYLAAGSTSWTANSDERLKDINGPLENALSSVGSLRAVKYTLKADEQDVKTQRVGVIAQDVKAVLPEIVDENQDGYLGIRYAEITPLLVAAIQEQQTLITALQADVAALKAK